MVERLDEATAVALRTLLVEAFKERLKQLSSQRRAARSDEAELAFVKVLPGTLLPEVLEEGVDELGKRSRKEVLEKLLGMDFDHLSAGGRQSVLRLYGSLRNEAGAGEQEKIVRRVSRSIEAEEPETRAQAARTMAVFLPELEEKNRKRCFNRLLDAATGGDEEVQMAAEGALRKLFGHLTAQERAAMKREGLS